MASLTEAPGTIRSAVARMSASIRAQLLLAPRVGLLEVDAGAEELARGEPVALAARGIRLGGAVEQVGAQVVADPLVGRGRRLDAALRGRRARRRRAVRRRRDARARKVAKKPSGAVRSSHWAMHSVTWRRGVTSPRSADSRRVVVHCSRAVGTAVSRVAMVAQSSWVAVGIRSKTSRQPCSGEAMTLSSIRS